MQRSDLDLLLRQKVQVVEGSLGSELARRRASSDVLLARVLLESMDAVGDIHRDFANAGATLHVSGSSDCNRLALKRVKLAAQFAEINQRSVSVCRDAVGTHHLVFGGLGSTGALLKPYGPFVESDYREVYAEQGEILLDAGVDGFFLEGFSSLIEAEQCLLALRKLSSVPVIATMTFLEDACTKFGDTMIDCFRSLKDKGADVVGVQGTLGPLEIDTFLHQLDRPFPLCVRPNAGYPVRVGGVMTYLSSPEYVAEFADHFLQKGAVVIGGAAGFTPEHIAAVANRVRGRKVPSLSPQHRVSFTQTAQGSDQREKSKNTSELSQNLGRKPLLTVELEPPRGLDVAEILTLIKRLIPLGVEAVNIPENPLARARISSIALARVIRDETGLDSIAHVTCRDRNLISLQAELLGAHVLGVHNVLALTGDPAGIGDYPAATSIFDLDSLGLVEMMTRMNMGKDFGMNELGDATQFNIGVVCNPLAEDLDDEIARLERKVARGASFVQTQPIFDVQAVMPFVRACEALQVPVLFGVMPIRDYRHARYLVNEYPGILVPDEDMERFRTTSESAQKKLSLDFARRLISELKPISGGVYLLPPFGLGDQLIEILEI